MKVIKYNFEPNLKKAFIDMNVSWIKKDYVLEAEDIRVLNEIDEDVKKGAIIYFTIEDEKPIATLCLTPLEDDTYELIKFAAEDTSKNKGAGGLVLKYALEDAKNFAKRIIIATNKKCVEAIHLYKKYGFVEYASNTTYGFSKSRVDVCYELIL